LQSIDIESSPLLFTHFSSCVKTTGLKGIGKIVWGGAELRNLKRKIKKHTCLDKLPKNKWFKLTLSR
jgi:hypothetical protein